MSEPANAEQERERLRREFFRLVLPKHLDQTSVDFYRLFDFADAHHRDFKQAPGFPHAILEDFLMPDAYTELVDALEGLERRPVWDPQGGALGVPRLSAELFLPLPVRTLLGELGMETFLAAMHSLTGVARLLPDPDRLEDGLVAIPSSMTFVPPPTPARHPRLGLVRRTRLMLFACRLWEEAWGGHVELRSNSQPGWSEVVPVRPNRCLVWNTPQHARVTHPAPVQHPDGAPLYCIYVTFYAMMPAAQGKQGT